MDDDHKDINDKLDSILSILNGNGKVGLCAKVNLLWGFSAIVLLASITAIAGSLF